MVDTCFHASCKMCQNSINLSGYPIVWGGGRKGQGRGGTTKNPPPPPPGGGGGVVVLGEKKKKRGGGGGGGGGGEAYILGLFFTPEGLRVWVGKKEKKGGKRLC